MSSTRAPWTPRGTIAPGAVLHCGAPRASTLGLPALPPHLLTRPARDVLRPLVRVVPLLQQILAPVLRAPRPEVVRRAQTGPLPLGGGHSSVLAAPRRRSVPPGPPAPSRDGSGGRARDPHGTAAAAAADRHAISHANPVATLTRAQAPN
eukprot:CAMPEP_0197589304 /NCGR_PEP_ID=MMETSP1326-20131121/10299_1 /TAXON_ID=1155430 /ORGANISM="Genus nov. species nov., Strain RCC2288" /LENGTH=149 /DNA_ID=CAMNT_0043154223 /DNA_START=172 /DNA_END=619 /DNA_ORIENTATION=-